VILALILLPLVAAAIALVAPPWLTRFSNVAAALATTAIAAVLTGDVLAGASPPTAMGGWLRADGLACVVALTVAVSAAIGAACGARSFTAEHPQAVRTYTTLSPLLAAALLVASLADHLGILWIALELAAVLAAFLIGSGGRREEHAAALKYMLLGSAGLVLALLATVVVHAAGAAAVGSGDAAMSFERLHAAGASLAPQSMRIALALAAAGYGLKVGLFPLHVWKPDAYAAAPGPVTALIAGGGVLVPLAALIRFGSLATASGEGAFTAELFTIAGVVSMIAALVLMANERDLRRLLAFTSVEHLGLILLAVGLGADTGRGALLHMVGNGVLKALAFGLLGLVVAERGSSDSHSGPGLYRHSFGLAAILLVVIAAGLGFPPFSMFTSEVTILRGLFADGQYLVGVLVLIALAGIFGVVATATLRLVFARADQAEPPTRRHGRAALAIGIPTLAATAVIGVGIPPWLWSRLGALAGEIAP
jgi:hydrogenase-4 component F